MLVLLLLAGTEVLQWYWVAIVFGGAAVVAVWRIVRAAPDLYHVAQIVDRRLDLHDTLSTAYHFGSRATARSESVRAAQLERALALAPGVDIRSALPPRRSRALYAAGALAAAAFGLFAVRYGVLHTLDARASLIGLALHNILPEEPTYQAEARKAASRRDPERAKDDFQPFGARVGVEERSLATGDETGSETTDGNTEAARAAKEAPGVRNVKLKGNDPNQQGNESSESERAAAQGNEQGSDPSSTDSPASANPSEKQNPQSKGNQAGQQNSLMDRMRDAMANLMNKLKMQSKGSQSEQASSKDARESGKSGDGQKGSPEPGKQQGNGEAQSEQNSQEGGQGEKSQMAQGRSGEKSGNNPPSNEPKSGVGKEDGDKSAREAEDLAAMGKLSEIMGKRAQNITGEIMVETQSNNRQQLKTAYSGKQALHSEAGGEISRDEVPLAYQQYVQQYFEQIRKTPAQPAAPKQKGARAAN